MNDLLKIDTSEIDNEDVKKAVAKIAIPSCLTSRPLVVGDKEQCSALRMLEKKVEMIFLNNGLDEDGNPLSGERVEYEVEVDFSGSVTVTITCMAGELERELDDFDVVGEIWNNGDIDIESHRIISQRVL